jgi:hypothetical protein
LDFRAAVRHCSRLKLGNTLLNVRMAREQQIDIVCILLKFSSKNLISKGKKPAIQYCVLVPATVVIDFDDHDFDFRFESNDRDVKISVSLKGLFQSFTM